MKKGINRPAQCLTLTPNAKALLTRLASMDTRSLGQECEFLIIQESKSRGLKVE
jgi:hypothetical protein